MAKVDLSEPAAAPVEPTNKIVLEIEVDDVLIEDVQAIDRIATGQPGAFADGVDVMAKFVKNQDIRKLSYTQLKAISQAVMAQFKEAVNPGN